MSLAEFLTPKDTDEIKPGLFIQNRRGGFRQIKPLAWNGKVRWKEQLRTIFCFRTIFTIAIILFLAWSYWSETSFCRELESNPCGILPNITEYCYGQERYTTLYAGIPFNQEAENGKELDASSLQNNP